MADIIQTYKLNFTGDQINNLLTRINNLDTELNTVKEEIKAYADNKRKTWVATIPTMWSGSGPYTQSMTVSGILESDMPHIMPVYSSNNTTALAQKEAWTCVSKAIIANNSITFTCFEDKPTTAIPIQIEVNR